MQLSRNSNDSSWEVFDVTMAELDLRGEEKKAKGSFLSLPSTRPSKVKKNKLTYKIIYCLYCDEKQKLQKCQTDLRI